MLENRLQDHDAGQLRLWKIKPRLDERTTLFLAFSREKKQDRSC